jgi:hypothetical protein
LISYEKKKKSHNNIYTIIKKKTIKNKIKNKYSEKIMKKEEKSYLNVVASEAKENFFFVKHIN